jgi:hypothetical protein
MAGLGYGLTYGLAYGLIVWGCDARILARSSAGLPGAKLAVGLPLMLLIGAATAALTGRSDRADIWVGTWIAAGALMGIVGAAMPFAGRNLATWVAEPLLWGTNVYPIGRAGVTRIAFVAIISGCAGSAVGLAGRLLTERVRRSAAPTGRMGARSWAALALCLPLALPPGLLGDELINRPLRISQRIVHETVAADLAGGSSRGGAVPDRDLISASYTLHLVDYDLEVPGQGTVDVAFDNGFVVRCEVSGYVLTGCSPISPHFEAWMGALIRERPKGGPGAELEPQAGRVFVGENVLDWLASQSDRMDGRYEISRDAQRGSWVVMSARFDTGYVLTCRFHGDSPVVVDHCSGN